MKIITQYGISPNDYQTTKLKTIKLPNYANNNFRRLSPQT